MKKSLDHRIAHVSMRLARAKLHIETSREWASIYFGKGDRFASVAIERYVLNAVFIGQAERRPMTTSKIASFIGIPRTTVIRKLAALKKSGDVEVDNKGRVTIPLNVLNAPEVLARLPIQPEILLEAARETLSKMDADKIEESNNHPYIDSRKHR